MLSEALTDLPYAFILHEPHLGKNYFAIQQNDVIQLAQHGIDLPEFTKQRLRVAFLLRRLRWAGYRQDYMMREFKFKLLPEMLTQIQQIGVKEIKHSGWQNYVRHFPDMRVVMTGRDPRDIYISMHQKWIGGTLNWPRPFTPDHISQELNHQFQMQLALRNEAECMDVTYERLCTDKTVFDEILSFIRSPITKLGDIGTFVSNHPKRVSEHDIHGDKITSQRVHRWKNETDAALVRQAHQVFEHMPAYCDFWEYEK